MDNIHPVVPADAPKLTQPQRILLAVASSATVTAVFWAGGDLIYRQQFESPTVWWVSVQLALVGWIAFFIELGAERSRQNQRLILDHLETLRIEMIELRGEVEAYGDGRERAGHALASTIRGNGNVRPLHTVE